MSDPGRRECSFYLDDMIRFAGKVLSYTNGLSQADFMKSEICYDAVLG